MPSVQLASHLSNWPIFDSSEVHSFLRAPAVKSRAHLEADVLGGLPRAVRQRPPHSSAFLASTLPTEPARLARARCATTFLGSEPAPLKGTVAKDARAAFEDWRLEKRIEEEEEKARQLAVEKQPAEEDVQNAERVRQRAQLEKLRVAQLEKELAEEQLQKQNDPALQETSGAQKDPVGKVDKERARQQALEEGRRAELEKQTAELKASEAKSSADETLQASSASSPPELAVNRPIIFQDVDGVLNRYEAGAPVLQEDLIANLARVVKNTDANLVISSQWRKFPDDHMPRLKEELAKAGIESDRIIGETPVFCSAWQCRAREIAEFLRKQPLLGHAGWVAVDDMNLEEQNRDFMHGHFVKTDPMDGLTSESADALEKMLKSEEAAEFQIPRVAGLSAQ